MLNDFLLTLNEYALMPEEFAEDKNERYRLNNVEVIAKTNNWEKSNFVEG